MNLVGDRTKKTTRSRQPEPIPLGSFQLLDPLGKGGMGEVWRGVHPAQDVPVAIKIVSAKRAVHDRFRSAFRNEVQAIARLNHPGIVMVLDYGEIPRAVEKATDGQLTEGTPYLVMELLTGGSMADRALPSSWAELRDILLAILDSLAYAHARGILHRDLSVRNVMWGTADDLRPGLRLIDFGLATLETRDGPSSDRVVAGTPAFQAPEQIAAWRARSQGPWTDLYAVGCLAFYLASGTLPFSVKTSQEMARSHLSEPPPALEPRIPVPDALDSWLQRLLQKEPARRFRSAADAAWNLAALECGRAGTPSVQIPAVTVPSSLAEDTPPMGTSESTRFVTLATMLDRPSGEPTPRSLPAITIHDVNLPPVEPAPVPTTWKRPITPPQPLQLLGAGLNLYGLRAIPMVGRESERDTIWRVLLEVDQDRQSRAILLSGAAGCGKTRLAEWVSERAHEIGCPVVMNVIHEPRPGPSSGLLATLARYLKCQRLDRYSLSARLDELFPAPKLLDHIEIRALRELLVPTDEEGTLDQGDTLGFRRTAARYDLIHRVIHELAGARFAVVVLDDVQWGGESLEFVQRVLSQQQKRSTPILFLLTARDESLALFPKVSSQVDELLDMDGACSISLGSLDRDSHQRLVEGLLLLDESLTRRVRERTGGNPLFAVHLIDDWVRRGILEVSDAGFQLKEGEKAVFPDSLHEVWAARIDRLVDDGKQNTSLGSETLNIALELAATLGQSVNLLEWVRACRDAAIDVDERLVDLLVTSRLASRQNGEWIFAHGMIRESLERRAEDAGRLQDHHRRCARILEPLSGARMAERLSRHHIAAGDSEEAVPTLLQASEARAVQGDCDLALEMLSERESILEEIGLDPNDRAWAQGWVNLAGVQTRLQNTKSADEFAARAISAARAHGWPDLEARALLWRARACNSRGAMADGAKWGSVGRVVALDLGDLSLTAELCNTLSNLCVSMAELDDAERYAQEALDCAVATGKRHLEGLSYANLGNVARHRGRHVEALAYYGRTPPILEEAGDAWNLAIATNNLADMARITGDLDAALTGYGQALRLFERISPESATWIELNIALVYITRGDFAAARPNLERAMEEFESAGQQHFCGIAQAFFLPVLAAEAAWVQWDTARARAEDLLSESKMYDPDIAEVGEMAAQVLIEADQTERARAAFGFALNQWQALKRPDDVARVKTLIRDL